MGFYSTCSSNSQCQDYVGLECMQSNDPSAAVNAGTNPLVCRYLRFNWIVIRLNKKKTFGKDVYRGCILMVLFVVNISKFFPNLMVA